PALIGYIPSDFVHIRDIAPAHVRVLEVEKAGGKRFITSSAPFYWKDWMFPTLPRGIPGSSKALNHIVFSHAKANKMPGIESKGIQDCLRDTVRDLEKRGWRVTV
ncbi:methylglyoxal reductase (NADPH-dependent) gre2, partial [Ceratobasidium sp. 423]